MNNPPVVQAKYRPSSASSMVESGSISSSTAINPLLKYNKGTKKVTERQHASVSKAAATAHANIKIVSANGLENMSESSIHQAVTEVADEASSSTTTGPSKSSITSNKEKYEDDESVSIHFSIPAPSSTNDIKEDLSKYKIGIFMRMAHPQGGALDPVVSLPLCSNNSNEGSSGECITNSDLTTGSVTFSQESMEQMMPGGSWPIDLYQWGTGFDAYVLGDSGEELVGPVKFNIMMDETY